MAKITKRDLIQTAFRARQHAVTPYSKFKVGAALATRSGIIVTGANVQITSYGLTCCAERVELFKALTEGYRQFAAVAVVAARSGRANAVRCLPAAFGRICANSVVWVADSRSRHRIKEFTVTNLLRAAFVTVPNILIEKTL